MYSVFTTRPVQPVLSYSFFWTITADSAIMHMARAKRTEAISLWVEGWQVSAFKIFKTLWAASNSKSRQICANPKRFWKSFIRSLRSIHYEFHSTQLCSKAISNGYQLPSCFDIFRLPFPMVCSLPILRSWTKQFGNTPKHRKVQAICSNNQREKHFLYFIIQTSKLSNMSKSFMSNKTILTILTYLQQKGRAPRLTTNKFSGSFWQRHLQDPFGLPRLNVPHFCEDAFQVSFGHPASGVLYMATWQLSLKRYHDKWP